MEIKATVCARKAHFYTDLFLKQFCLKNVEWNHCCTYKNMFKYLQVEQIMGKFEKQFEDIDVRTSVSLSFEYMYKWKFFPYLFFDSQRRVPTCEFSFYRRPWRIPWVLPPHYPHLRTKWSRWWNRSPRRMTLTLPNNSQILTQRLPPSGKTRRRRRKMICHEGMSRNTNITFILQSDLNIKILTLRGMGD